MHDLLINERSVKLSNKQFSQLLLVLPYWGLTLNEDNSLRGRLKDRVVKLSLKDHKLRKMIEQYLKHTGVTLLYEENTAFDFIISYHEKSDISIRANNMTFHLNTTHQNKTLNLQKKIHKRIWLPIKKSPVNISLPLNSSHQQQSEWLSYLLIQFLCQDSFEPIAHIPLSDYQTLVEDYLKELNTSFASIQLNETALPRLPSWPEPPSIISNGNIKNDTSNVGRQQPSNRNIDHESDEVPKSDNPFTLFGPFTSKTKGTADPINPFRATHEDDPSTFDPFKRR